MASQWGLNIWLDVRSLSSLISMASSVAASWAVWDAKAAHPGKPSRSTRRSWSSVARGMVTVGVAQAAMAKTSDPQCRQSQMVEGCIISSSCWAESTRGDEDPCVLHGAARFRWWVCWALAVEDSRLGGASPRWASGHGLRDAVCGVPTKNCLSFASSKLSPRMLRVGAVVRQTCAGGGASAGLKPALVGLASNRSRHTHMPQQGLPLARLCFEMLHPLGLAAARPWHLRTTRDVARSRGTRCGQVRSWMACSPPGRHGRVAHQRSNGGQCT
jgi:hypothetical protein